VTTSLKTTSNTFLDGRVSLRQPERGFRSGLDAVFLAAACPAQGGEHVLEAGCGAGAASLCLVARVPGVLVTGVEIEADLAALANENAMANGTARSFKAVAADITFSWTKLEALGLRRESYDHVIANPPFYAVGRSKAARDTQNARARAMHEDGLDAWMRFLSAAAKPGATCTIVHAAEALPQVVKVFEGRFGAMVVTPVYPKANAAAIRILVTGKKGSRAPFSIAPGIVLHEADGVQSKAAEAILRGGCGLN
jgi:tRNA1(Val) A37 N6-methylase TrmN6